MGATDDMDHGIWSGPAVPVDPNVAKSLKLLYQLRNHVGGRLPNTKEISSLGRISKKWGHIEIIVKNEELYRKEGSFEMLNEPCFWFYDHIKHETFFYFKDENEATIFELFG